MKQPFDCCLRAIKFGSRPTAGDFRGKVRLWGVAGFVPEARLSQVATSWLSLPGQSQNHK